MENDGKWQPPRHSAGVGRAHFYGKPTIRPRTSKHSFRVADGASLVWAFPVNMRSQSPTPATRAAEFLLFAEWIERRLLADKDNRSALAISFVPGRDVCDISELNYGPPLPAVMLVVILGALIS